MLKNVVFDMGNVLIRFDPEYFVRRAGADGADYELLLEHVYHAPVWPQLDAGACSEADVYAYACQKLPERLHALAHQLIYAWDAPIEPIPGMEALIRWVKEKGLGAYLLSNASVRQRDYWMNIPGANLFDGRIISAEHRMVKPNPAIYRLLLDTYHLQAAECLFVDDVEVNVQGARDVGMLGYCFTGDAASLKTYIENLSEYGG